MASQSDPLRHLFDGLVERQSPTPPQVESAWRSLSDAMADTTVQPRRKPRLVTSVAAVAAVVLMVAIVSVQWIRTPAEALLGELAEATRSISPQELPEGSYVYVARDELVSADNAAQIDGEWIPIQYLLPIRTETWTQGDTQQLETTVGDPVFFDAETEQFYYENGLDAADQVGVTRLDAITGIDNLPVLDEWSTSPDVLADQLRMAAEADPAPLPMDVRIIEAIMELLIPELVASPELRAATIEVLADLDLDQQSIDSGGVAASITYEDPGFGTVTLTVSFDGAGHLIGVEKTTLSGSDPAGLPANTTFERMTQTPPTIVAEPGDRP